MKRFFGWFFSILSSLLVLVLVIEFCYLPDYFLNRKEVSLPDEERGEVVVMSANVRFFNPFDVFSRSWFFRAKLVRADLDLVKPDIVGFQEVTPLHYDYLKKILPQYDSTICYRDDFILSEGCPVFYRTDKYELLDEGSFWLSETPEVMSKSWGSDHYRVATYVILKDRISGEELVVFNTHLDNKSKEARVEGIALVAEKIRELGSLPSILMGDLNATPESETILSTNEAFDDAAVLAQTRDSGATYHAFGKEPDRERIDYFLLSKGDFAVSEYRIVDNGRSGEYSSDHAPIYIRLRLH